MGWRSSDALDLNLGSAWFESWPGYLAILMDFIQCVQADARIIY